MSNTRIEVYNVWGRSNIIGLELSVSKDGIPVKFVDKGRAEQYAMEMRNIMGIDYHYWVEEMKDEIRPSTPGGLYLAMVETKNGDIHLVQHHILYAMYRGYFTSRGIMKVSAHRDLLFGASASRRDMLEEYIASVELGKNTRELSWRTNIYRHIRQLINKGLIKRQRRGVYDFTDDFKELLEV